MASPRASTVERACGAATLCLAGSALAGAAAHLDRLASWIGGLPAAAPLTAGVMVGVGLAHVARPTWRWSALVLGAASLGLAVSAAFADVGRPAPPATTLIGVGAAAAAALLVGLGAPVAAQVLASLVAVVGGVAVLAFVYGDRLTTVARSRLPNTDTAAPIAYALLFSAVAVFAATPDHGITAWVTRDSPGRRAVRRLLPPVAGLPLLLAAVARWIDLDGSVGAPRAWAIVMSVLVLGIFAIAAVAVPLIDHLAFRARDADLAELRLETALRDARVAGLARRLAAAITVADVAEVVNVGVTRALRARAASYGLVDLRGRDLLVQHGPTVGPAVARRYASIPLELPLALTDAARTGQAVFVTDHADYRSKYPDSEAASDQLGSGGRVALPLTDSDGATFGSLVVAWDEPMEFDESLRSTLSTVGELVAQSIARARLADDLARDVRRQGALAELAESLAGASSLREVLSLLAAQAARPVDGADCVVGLLDPAGRRLRRYFAPTTPPEVRALGEWSDLEVDSPLVVAARTGEPVLVADRDQLAGHPEQQARFDGTGFGATANLPLRNREGQLVGAIGIGWATPVAFDPSTRVLMATVAELAAQSVQRAWLADERHRDATRAEQLSQMAEALAAASTAHEVVGVVASDGPAILGSATALLDPTEQARPAAPPRVDRRSMVVDLPSVDAQRCLGTLHLGWRSDLRDDGAFRVRLDTVVELVGQTLERVRLAEAEHRLVADLQERTIRPIPSVAGVEVAGRYQPAAAVVGMGGDWFEVLELDPQHVGLVVGDVVGHGVASAAEMSQVSAVLSTVLSLGIGLEDFFARVHDVMGQAAPRFIATAAVCVLEIATGELRCVSAGHPPPVVLRADGSTSVVTGGRTPVVGMPQRTVEPSVARLDVGDTVFLYTDGLVERRGEDLEAGLDRLRGALARLGPGSTGERVDRLVATCLDGGRIEDDVAVVALRRAGGLAVRGLTTTTRG